MLPSTFIGFPKGFPIDTCVSNRNEKSKLKYQLIAAVAARFVWRRVSVVPR